MKGIITGILAIVVAVVIIILAYNYMTPISFFFITGLVLLLFFFLTLYFRRKADSTGELPRWARLLAVLILLALFGLSLFVMKDYQQPGVNRPYFTNIDHHAIRNYGIGFSGRLDLYKAEADSANGIWPSRTGSFSVLTDDAGGATFTFTNFYKPVFGRNEKKGSYLLNPLLEKPLTNGFTINDSVTSLRWNDVKTGKKAGKARLSFQLIFSTSDYFLTLDKDRNAVFRDTLLLDEAEIGNAADFRSVLRKSSQFRKLYTGEVINRWLDRYEKIYLVPQTDEAGKTTIHFFPQEDFFAGCTVLINGSPQRVLRTSNVQFNIRDRFYAGVENRDKLLHIRLPDSVEKIAGRKDLRILEMEEFASHPLSASALNGRQPGTAELRFLKNNYQQLGLSEIREGFLFHDEVKDNGFTGFDAVIRYSAGPSGAPLDYEVIGFDPRKGWKDGNQFFRIFSKNRQLLWYFSLDDFSRNPYDFAHGRFYLALLVLVMCIMIIFYPGKNLLYIETPLLVIVYMLMVFRLLLLWRVATFPPLKSINQDEFDFLRLFDMKPKWQLPVPVSFLAVTGVLVSVIVVRWWRLRKEQQKNLLNTQGVLQPPFDEKYPMLNKVLSKPILAHLIILLGCYGVRLVSKSEFLERICNILIPLASYIYFTYRLLLREDRFHYHNSQLYKNPLLKTASSFFIYIFENPGSVLSAMTLAFFMMKDTGFGILFLFFLLFKRILFSFHRSPALDGRYTIFQRMLRPSAYWIYGFLSLALFLFAVAYKKSFYQLLEHKWLVFTIVILLLTTAAALIMKRGRARSAVLLGFTGLLVAAYIPQIRAYADTRIEKKIRNVKYRTSILTDSLESILFKYPYNSAQEQKIIETAQGQWFINSYLNLPASTGPGTDNRKIRLREHFNKGVDYTTQTRDVVLPRYVIAEFGGFAMLCLLTLFFIPVFLFFMSYRVSKEKMGLLLPGGAVPAMALILLFIISLFVWLTSTNRFVFFGQDFPFLSLTSRLSTILPMLLLGAVLLSKPQIRSTVKTAVSFAVYRWLLFGVLLAAVIISSGRSSQVSEEKFKIDFSRMESRIDTVNDIFSDIQSAPREKKMLLAEDFRKKPEAFLAKVKQLLIRLSEDEEFAGVFNTATVYEKSIFNRLKENPRMGFDAGSPVHLKFDVQEKRLLLAFNKYWGLELPNYNIKEVWQGDIAEGAFGNDNQNKLPVMHAVGQGARVIVIPAGYLKPGNSAKGLLFPDAGGLSKNESCYIFDKDKRTVVQWNPANPAGELNENDVVFFSNSKSGHFSSWVMRENSNNYFAYSYLINGVQKHIYPLGNRFYWARHWTNASKLYFESQEKINENSIVSLDYKLNRNVSNLLLGRLPAYRNRLSDLTFSVIGADGNGNIRLMGDYAAQREVLDPNDDYRIALKEKDQYFNVDINAERLQWGNLNLLRMPLGPGSSLKPVVACAVTSQLKAEWSDLVYQTGTVTVIPGKEEPVITHYAGLDLKADNWPVKSRNATTDFRSYLSNSNNLYHSLLMFFGSYSKDRFSGTGGNSLKNVLTQNEYGQGVPQFPVMTIGESGPYYFNRIGEDWPVTNKVTPANGSITYFGNPVSLLANGLKTNFELYVNPTDRSGQVKGKSPMSQIIPDSALEKGTWASPESSHFLQYLRIAEDPVENFNRGFRAPALGGSPISVTPLKMLEMYGKMITFKSRFRGTIDFPSTDSSVWNYDTAWGALSSYQEFAGANIFQAMENAVANGTAAPLTGGQHQYGQSGYYLYAKTGTIDDNQGDNSKRLILIISKDPLQGSNYNNSKVYLLYFTINNAYGTDDTDKSWFWQFYRDILDEVMKSDSFKKYMSN